MIAAAPLSRHEISSGAVAIGPFNAVRALADVLALDAAMAEVVIHSDGACRGNPGPGGWAAVLTSGTTTRELSGGVPATTNNRMELQAAIEALQTLKRPCEVEFFTDSKYVQNGISLWLAGWKRGGWRTKA